jgi:hypothetical protein
VFTGEKTEQLRERIPDAAESMGKLIDALTTLEELAHADWTDQDALEQMASAGEVVTKYARELSDWLGHQG